MGLFDDVGHGILSAATGGALGRDGYLSGGNGMLDVYNRSFKSSGFTDWIPGIGDKSAQDKANEMNLRESALNREFQARMSSTAYQRGMKDMEKAGLNPTLAYMQGGASAPSGSTATVQSAPKTALFDAALKATTGVGGMQMQKTALEQQQAMNDSSIKLNQSTAAKNVMDAESTRLKNVRNKKYEPLDDLAGKASSAGKKLIDRLLDSISGTAKATNNFKGPEPKKIETPKHFNPNQQKFFEYLEKNTKPFRRE